MIIQCQGCTAKYFLPEDKVPAIPTRVRCPKCTAVFMLSPQREPVSAGARVSADPGVAPAPTPAPPVIETVAANDSAAPAPPVEPRPEPEAPETPPAVEATTDKKTASRSKGRSKEDRAKRLARVLVSDILCYNQDNRDQALQDGTLMTVLGEEIKKSWELYKEKVGPDVASSTNYFKEALNEILANGQKVF